MTINITINNWAVQKEAARHVRMNVFVIEQQVPIELEWDTMDEQCIHAVATDETGAAVGTGRLLPDGHIGRMAVLATARGQGVGGQILMCLICEAQERGDKRVVLSAQRQAEGFYERFGFKVVGEEYMEAGINHIDMEFHFK
ncbi:GNAT family N-acetyltransferase [Solimicrobium silvestre]|uniref:Putative acyltransferase n=1 Tax=Solimicrobium silvestre TaxID=2099400 RepID=A0A2S9GU77_9BURK|nr:GNAT family N-acetyltransferase [Solimicrobium silvestre]PRC91287.1 putative acyltransferase [Solimicrobium silvestre]